MMIIGSLFSGFGLLEHGLAQALLARGIRSRVAWQAEKDPYARAVLEKHWPETYRYEDVHDISEKTERCDIICGGFPCQDLSIAADVRASLESSPACGSSSSASFAFFDRGTCSWRTCQSSWLSSEKYSGRWPNSGTMRSGTCLMRHRSVPRTAASGSLSLPTPMASDFDTGNPAKIGPRLLPTPMVSDQKAGSEAGMRRRGPQLRDMAAGGMWPTPTATDAKSPGAVGNERQFPSLREVVRMLPTPTASTFTRYKSASAGAQTRLSLEGMARAGQWRDQGERWATPKASDAMQPGRSPGRPTASQPLSVQVQTNWDAEPRPNAWDLEPVISRPGRLNPQFVEWLMGVEVDWTLVSDERASVALETRLSGGKRSSRS